MNKCVAKRWAGWLRRNKDKQIFGHFVDGNGYCAYQALREMAKARSQPIHGEPAIQDWAEIGSKGRDKIIRLNDVRKLSFPKIADFIERNYKAL